MTIQGRNLVAGVDAVRRDEGRARKTFRAMNPATREQLDQAFEEADESQVGAAAEAAGAAFLDYHRRSPAERAGFLEGVAASIEALGEALIDRAAQESGLGPDRLRGERGRTVSQLRMFARLIDEGSWVDARIDTAIPDRKPAPKPDLRRMLIALGPVAVFGASNFPLAFSVAGGDTASAFAAGCSVVFKAHPAHPGTSELVASAVIEAARKAGMPAGVFSMIHARDPSASLALVRHPLIKAVGFTGSLNAGRALFDAAAGRAEPIPVYAEMGSINPVFVLPNALVERAEKISEGLAGSVTLGVGQFCTNPGLVVGLENPAGAFAKFQSDVAGRLAEAPAGVMLYQGLQDAYVQGVRRFESTSGVKHPPSITTPAARDRAKPIGFSTDAGTFLAQPSLSQELFGPSTLIVSADSREQVLEVARKLEGHLTATIHGTEADLREWPDLIDILRQKAGRLIFNGFPTGVEVCAAMQHGGPYPAASDPRTTSVGTAAIERFVRPVCYQDFPQSALPPELQDANPRRIWRIVDGRRTT